MVWATIIAGVYALPTGLGGLAPVIQLQPGGKTALEPIILRETVNNLEQIRLAPGESRGSFRRDDGSAGRTSAVPVRRSSDDLDADLHIRP